jgi:mRNA interferase MazF
VRGDIYRVNNTRATGHQQRGPRFAVVVQSSDLPLSTWLVCPTSTSAQPSRFRPEVEIPNQGRTLVLTDQLMAINPQSLGAHVGNLSLNAIQAVDQGLRIVLDL